MIEEPSTVVISLSLRLLLLVKKNRPANLKLRRSKFVYAINEKSRLSPAFLSRSDFEKLMGQISLHKRLFIRLSVSVDFVAQLVVASNWYLRVMGSNSVESQFFFKPQYLQLSPFQFICQNRSLFIRYKINNERDKIFIVAFLSLRITCLLF